MSSTQHLTRDPRAVQARRTTGPPGIPDRPAYPTVETAQPTGSKVNNVASGRQEKRKGA